MNWARLILSGVRFHWRAHLGTVLGVALGTSVIVGALLVSDSLKGTLLDQAESRVGFARAALFSGEKLFRSALAADLAADCAPALLLEGSASRGDGAARLNSVQVLGVDSRFWGLALESDRRELKPGDAVVSDAMARKLDLKVGDSIVLRTESPSLLSRDAPLSGEEESIVTIRLNVVAVADARRFGRFSLSASQVPPASIFLSLETLQSRLEVPGKANLILSRSLDEAVLSKRVLERWNLEDVGLEIRSLGGAEGLEIRSPQVFLPPAIQQRLPEGNSALTYFVNSIEKEDRSTPYSMVTAAVPGSIPFLPADFADDEVIVSDWLAEDLGVKPGDEISMRYFIAGERRVLEEQKKGFRVREIASLGAFGWDSSWAPEFPGLSAAVNCRDWKPGFSVSFDRIREKDEAFWKTHRGTPKAFISLKAGQALWANRWGNATSVRYSEGALSAADVMRRVQLGDSGLKVLSLRAMALQAAEAPVDFAGLFGGMSIFVIAAGLCMVGLLFGLMVEKRRGEAATLLALGWEFSMVRKIFLSEGFLGSLVGAVLGLGGALAFSRGVIGGLGGVWRGAVSGAEIEFHTRLSSFLVGAGLSVLMAFASICWASRSLEKASLRQLFSEKGMAGVSGGRRPGLRARWVALFAFLAGAALTGGSLFKRDVDPVMFFLGGGLLLVASLAALKTLLCWQGDGGMTSIRRMAWRNMVRRPGRSLAVAAVLASGAFLVLSVSVFRKVPGKEEAAPRGSGTGGFALMAQLTAPIYENLNDGKVRDAHGLAGDPQLRVLQIREKKGDDASCLNLNRAVSPRVLGVPSSELQELGAFRFTRRSDSWALLRRPSDGWIPAVADAATIRWALKKSIGDEIRIEDGNGGEVRLRLVAALSGSILQGALLVDEANFRKIYPQVGGYRVLLMDVPKGEEDSIRSSWAKALMDRGTEIAKTSARMEELDAVSNTYLSIFQALGGLGVLLGACGVGVVAARNVVDRRSELAILSAMGWRRRQIRRLLSLELGVLIFYGALLGSLSAGMVTLPVQWMRGDNVDWQTLLGALGGLSVLSCGAVWFAVRVTMPTRAHETLQAE